MNTRPMLLSVPDVMRELGISRAGCYRLMASGALETCHVGRLVRIYSQSLEDYAQSLRLAEQNRQVTAPPEPSTDRRELAAAV